MTSDVSELSRYADVSAALADPSLVPLPARSGPVGTMAWLRATVARFCAGETHARRRALVQADLDQLDPAALRRAAASSRHHDARLGVVSALAEGLGLAEPDAIAHAITVVAGAYFGGDDPAADAAVAWLLQRCGIPTGPAAPDDARAEIAANRIGLLVQACDATADLIGRAMRVAGRDPAVAHRVEALLAETLRHNPPVRATRRIAVQDTQIGGTKIAEGDTVVLDIAAANRDPEVFAEPDTFDLDRLGPPGLAFGCPPRPCPGRQHALALAAGVLARDMPAGTAP